MDSIKNLNNNNYYQNYLQKSLNSIYSKPEDSIYNTKNNYRPENYSQIASSIPLTFNIPRQTNFLNYQPSTPTRKKNIINLNDNSKLKRASNIPVLYKKLYTFDSLNNYNKENIRYGSPLPNKYINKDNYILPYSQSPNINEKIFRSAKTPEPKKINFNEYHSQNQYNINIFVNNSNNPYNSLVNENHHFGSPKKIKQNPYAYKNINKNNNLKTQNNLIIKKLNDVNYNSLSNNSNLIQNNYSSKDIGIANQIIPKSYNYNSPIRRNYITMSPDRNTIFYNSPHHVSIGSQNIIVTEKNNNYYNSPIKTNKLSDSVISNISNYNNNNINSHDRNNVYNTLNQNNNIINKNYYPTNGRFSNNYYSPERYNSPKDNMRQKQLKNKKEYHQIKYDNYNKKIFPQKIIHNRVNLIPIPKKILNDTSISNPSISNLLNNSTSPSNNNLNHANFPGNNIKRIQVNQNNIQQRSNGNNTLFLPINNILVKKEEPQNDFNPKEFKILKKLGEGTFGKIYAIKWLKTNELFAMKKMDLVEYDVYVFKKKVRIIQNFFKNTGHNGLIKLYGDKCIPRQKIDEFFYYVIMELAETDLEKEIKKRKELNKYYTEGELLNFILQMVKTLSLMEKNSITHRDVKPQNILLIKGMYKLCDFGETKIISGVGPILQAVRGSELYMSPILFYAYNRNVPNVLHNTYKSDVFSLGMCTLLVASLSLRPLCDIREIKNMVTIETIIINNLVNRYSKKMINLILKMLEIDENLRMDFIQLEEYISNVWPDKEYYFR